MTDKAIISAMLTALQENIDDDGTWNELHDYLIDNGVLIHKTPKKDTLIAACKEIATREGRSRIDDVQFHSEYAEPGYSDNANGIAVGNWNEVSRWDLKEKKSVVIDTTPELFSELLEKLGVSLEWSDEWTTCDSCGKLIRTSPNSYDWTPFYERDGETVCHNCEQPNDEEESEDINESYLDEEDYE